MARPDAEIKVTRVDFARGGFGETRAIRYGNRVAIQSEVLMAATAHGNDQVRRSIWRLVLAYLLLGGVWILLAGVVVHVVFGIHFREAGMISFASLMAIFIALSALIIAQQEARFQRDLIRRERVRRLSWNRSAMACNPSFAAVSVCPTSS